MKVPPTVAELLVGMILITCCSFLQSSDFNRTPKAFQLVAFFRLVESMPRGSEAVVVECGTPYRMMGFFVVVVVVFL